MIGLVLLAAGVWWLSEQGARFGAMEVGIIAVVALIILAPWLGSILKFTGKLIWTLIKLAVILLILGVILYFILVFLSEAGIL